MGVVKRIALLLASAATALPMAAYGQTTVVTPDDVRPRGQHNFIMPTLDELTNPRGMEEYRQMGREIARTSTQQAMDDIAAQGIERGILPAGQTPAIAFAAAPGDTVLPSGFRVTILVTAAMGANTLEDLFARYSYRKDVRFAFRGVAEGMSVPEFALWLQRIIDPDGQGRDDLNINIDPELFEHAGATMAPMMILENFGTQDSTIPTGMDLGSIAATATGFTDPDWLYEQYEAGRIANASANVVEIAEEDLRNRATREAENVAARLTRDPEVLKNRYWDRIAQELRWMRIERAGADRERMLHFVFQTQEPIRHNDGNILAHAGEVFQPNDVLPFDRRIFVFNPNVPAEVDYVETALQTALPNVTRAMLLLSEMPAVEPGQEPWQGIQDLVNRFGMQVFLLNSQFRRNFQIEATPSEIFPREIAGRVEVFNREISLQ